MTGEKPEKYESTSMMMGDFSGMATSRWQFLDAPDAANRGFVTWMVSWFTPGRNLNNGVND